MVHASAVVHAFVPLANLKLPFLYPVCEGTFQVCGFEWLCAPAKVLGNRNEMGHNQGGTGEGRVL